MSTENNVTIDNSILVIKSWWKFINSKIILFIFLILCGSSLGFWYSISSQPKYEGLLTFVLSSESKASGFAGIASQFGLDLGGGGGNDVFSGDNIITLFQSKRMIKPVLFKKPPGNTETLLNILVKDLKLDQKWNSSSYLRKCLPFPTDINQVSPLQDSLINEIYIKLLEENLNVIRPDKKLSVYKVSTVSHNEIFSCYLTKYLVDETAAFYIETKTSVSKNNLNMLNREADSLKRLLGGTIVNNATEVDRTFNLNPALQVQRSSIQKGQVNVTVLATAYGEVVKNLELAKINLQRESPLYQIIDSPELPLKAERFSKMKGLIYGTIIAILVVFIISCLMFIFSTKKY